MRAAFFVLVLASAVIPALSAPLSSAHHARAAPALAARRPHTPPNSAVTAGGLIVTGVGTGAILATGLRKKGKGQPGPAQGSASNANAEYSAPAPQTAPHSYYTGGDPPYSGPAPSAPPQEFQESGMAGARKSGPAFDLDLTAADSVPVLIETL